MLLVAGCLPKGCGSKMQWTSTIVQQDTNGVTMVILATEVEDGHDLGFKAAGKGSKQDCSGL